LPILLETGKLYFDKVYNVIIVQEVAAFLLAAGSDLRCVQTLTGSGSAAEETASDHLNKAVDRTTMGQKNTNGLLIAA
jgi:hypothetical protein